jgi:hypothetical protein
MSMVTLLIANLLLKVSHGGAWQGVETLRVGAPAGIASPQTE